MTYRSWPLLLPLLLAGLPGQPPLRAQDAEPQALLPPMPQELPRQTLVPDVLLPGTAGSLARNALQAPGPDPAAPPLAYPLAQPAESLDPWGWRYSQRRSAWRLHTGVDLAAPQGTVVLASRAGRVLLVESISGYGTTVLLDHGEGWQTLYAHLHYAIVVSGAWLEQGQPLGSVGMTGSATGPHLHFELRRQGTELLALDPTPHLPLLLPPPALPPVLATITP
jgi:murein DD-endopeptidase MepM/ murein hydrolase activator NlpD